MYIETFKDTKEANEFIETVVLDDNGVHYTADGNILVFYKYKKDNYQDAFRAEMIEKLERELFNAELAYASALEEVSGYKNKAMQSELDEAMKKQKNAQSSVEIYKNKIAALKTWTADNTSSE